MKGERERETGQDLIPIVTKKFYFAIREVSMGLDMTVYQERGDDFLAPVVQVQRALVAYQAKKDFIDQVLKKDIDFGEIPGTGKPTLLKPGAEKMVNLFGLAPEFEDVCVIEDWSGAVYGEPFFYYRQRCKLVRGGRLVGSAEGSCNSWEKKYRYRWVAEADIPAGMDKAKLATRGGRMSEFEFALDKAETTGQYGKPAEYWKRFKDAIAAGTATRTTRKTKTGKQMDAWEIDTTLYQVPNAEIAELVNTVLKMAQKRALIGAVLITTGVSEFFTQDIEDYVDAVFVETAAPVQAPAAQPTQPAKPAAPVQDSAPEMPEEPPFAAVDAQFTTAPAPAPAPIANGSITLETAENLKNEQGVRYGDLPTDKLSNMTIGIGKALRKADITAEQRAEYQLKMDAIGMILRYRAEL